MRTIDGFLNKVTMYRLAFVGLGTLAAISILLAFLQLLHPYTALQLTVSLITLFVAAWISNAAFALFAKASPTPESAIITALILFFVFTPVGSIGDMLLLAGFATLAMLSKYVLAINRRHVFNPAAFAALVASITGIGSVGWWVATPLMLPFVLILGLLVVRKLRRFDLFITFLVLATGTFVVRTLLTHLSFTQSLTQFVTSWPLFFFGTIMVTEPQTMPATRSDRVIYGSIIGLLYSLSFSFGPVAASPQLALVVGNLYSYAVSFKRRVSLKLKEVIPLTRDIFEFVFLPDRSFMFAAGQYGEFTLPHRGVDKRGIRRYFTIASAPEDPYLRLGMRVPVEGSSFKEKLRDLTPGSRISMTGLAGEFTLPHDPNERIAAIAGGIGITPFMSMFRYLAERREHRNIVLIYAATSPLDFAYQEELDRIAPLIGLSVLYLPIDFTELTKWEGKSGYLTAQIVREEMRDFDKRTWYLSGPGAMVQSYKKLIREMGVPANAIKTDYFPGL